MTTDPYSSPADAAEPRSANPLLPVAITLIVMSVLWILFTAYASASLWFVLASNADLPGVQSFWMYGGSLLIVMLYQVPIIAGCVCMIRKSSYVWSFVTCWLACVPGLGPCYLLAIPVGIWGLVVLRRSATRALFPPIPPARDPLLGVAIGLATMAALGLIFALFGLNYFTTMAAPNQGLQANIPLGFLAANFLYQLALIYGATKMVGTGSYRFAVITCCLACVPFLGPCYFFAIPFGIWGLLVLRRPEVRAGWDGERKLTYEIC